MDIFVSVLVVYDTVKLLGPLVWVRPDTRCLFIEPCLMQCLHQYLDRSNVTKRVKNFFE